MSYGGTLAESHRWIGVYTGQILKGEKPANLPVQQSTKVELIVNLRSRSDSFLASGRFAVPLRFIWLQTHSSGFSSGA
jgi:hypothetical protein